MVSINPKPGNGKEKFVIIAANAKQRHPHLMQNLNYVQVVKVAVIAAGTVKNYIGKLIIVCTVHSWR